MNFCSINCALESVLPIIWLYRLLLIFVNSFSHQALFQLSYPFCVYLHHSGTSPRNRTCSLRRRIIRPVGCRWRFTKWLKKLEKLYWREVSAQVKSPAELIIAICALIFQTWLMRIVHHFISIQLLARNFSFSPLTSHTAHHVSWHPKTIITAIIASAFTRIKTRTALSNGLRNSR